MKSYKIVKSSRSDDSPPYAGPTCAQAKVNPGKVYYRRASADRACRLLSEANPVGFKVVTMGDGPDDLDLLETIKDLATENGRHYFGMELVAEEAGIADISEMKRALYRLNEGGQVGILPGCPEIEEADRITSVCLSSEVLI
jgi:hypothetical protein